MAALSSTCNSQACRVVNKNSTGHASLADNLMCCREQAWHVHKSAVQLLSYWAIWHLLGPTSQVICQLFSPAAKEWIRSALKCGKVHSAIFQRASPLLKPMELLSPGSRSDVKLASFFLPAAHGTIANSQFCHDRRLQHESAAGCMASASASSQLLLGMRHKFGWNRCWACHVGHAPDALTDKRT